MDRLLREHVWRRAESCCEYCQMPQSCIDASHEIDHVLAINLHDRVLHRMTLIEEGVFPPISKAT